MRSGERVAATLAALDAASPAHIPAVLRGLLAEHLKARNVELLIVDYRLAVLHAVDSAAAAIPVDGTTAGRAFTSQQPVVEPCPDTGVRIWVPITVRGERFGVLQLDLPAAPSSQRRRELMLLATVIGHALRAANKDTDVYTQAARSERLSLAAELQWQLLPGRGPSGPQFSLAGQLEPAYHVGGGSFDWSCAHDHILVSACDATGQGAQAALLTTLAVTALRNARRAGLTLADQACLADQAVFAQHAGEHFAEALLLRVELNTGLTQAISAGSARLLRLRDGVVERIDLDDQLPLGMFEDTNYTEQQLNLIKGDRLVIITAGVHAARSLSDEKFGHAKLELAVAATGNLRTAEATRYLIQQLVSHHEGQQLRDDATLVCLDWTSCQSGPPVGSAGSAGTASTASYCASCDDDATSRPIPRPGLHAV